jgi:hypothetical protein
MKVLSLSGKTPTALRPEFALASEHPAGARANIRWSNSFVGAFHRSVYAMRAQFEYRFFASVVTGGGLS